MDGLDKLSIVELCDLLASKTLLLLNAMQTKHYDGEALKDLRKEVVAVQKTLEEKRRANKYPQ